MTNHKAAITWCALVNSSLGLAQVASPTTVKPTIFVDQIRCEGLTDENKLLELKKNFDLEADGKILAQQVSDAECYAVFSPFGIEKFAWTQVENLTNAVYLIKKSQRFADVRIETSPAELPGHVHVKAYFQPQKPFIKTSFTTTKSLAKGSANEGDRSTTVLSANIVTSHFGPYSSSPMSASLKWTKSSADRPLDLTSTDQLSPEEMVSLSRTELHQGSANFRVENPRSGSSNFFFELEMGGTILSGDDRVRLTTKNELGLAVYPNPLNPRDKVTFSLLYASGLYPSYEVLHADPLSGNARGQSLAFFGFTEQVKLNYIDVSARFYRSLSRDLQYFGDMQLALAMTHLLAGTTQGLGTDAEIVKGAILPEHLLGLSDRMESRVFAFWKDSFSLLGGKHQAGLKVGFGSYQSLDDDRYSYSRSQGYGELTWQTNIANLDVNLGLIYGNKRYY